MESQEQMLTHKLYDNWTLWAHLPHDTNWNPDSYTKIFTIETIEQGIALLEQLPDIMIKNCMLFVMRNTILPIWEDPQNINGGSFSYKIPNKSVKEIWKNFSYLIMSECMIGDEKIQLLINGITISPKKNFCIIKIWVKDCSISNPEIFNKLSNINLTCLFKKHTTD